jgi:hypothetical protein
MTKYLSLIIKGGGLWEVGLYDSTNGNRVQATWDTPTTWHGSITVNSGSDVVVATVYDVALQSDSENVTLVSVPPIISNITIQNGVIK